MANALKTSQFIQQFILNSGNNSLMLGRTIFSILSSERMALGLPLIPLGLSVDRQMRLHHGKKWQAGSALKCNTSFMGTSSKYAQLNRKATIKMLIYPGTATCFTSIIISITIILQPIISGTC